jgi:hypothetical protein
MEGAERTEEGGRGGNDEVETETEVMEAEMETEAEVGGMKVGGMKVV